MKTTNKRRVPLKSGGAAIRRKRKNRSMTAVYVMTALGLVVCVTAAYWFFTRPSMERADELLVQGNVSKAAVMYTTLADAGDEAAAAKLGRMYYNGSEIPKDHAKATGYLDLAARSDDTDARVMLADIHYHGGAGRKDHPKAFELLAPLQDSDNVHALALLGRMYHNGEGVEQDFGQAILLLSKAESLGDASSADILGLMYYHGRGTEADPEKAAKHLSRVPAGKSRDVDLALGKMLYLGKGVEASPVRAATRFAKCDVGDDPEANYCLGMLYYEGIGVPRDDALAARHLQTATAAGVEVAQFPLGVLYYRGGVDGKPDYAKAKIHLENALRSGDAAAASILGKMAYQGLGMEVDYPKAAQWLAVAVKNHNSIENSLILGKLHYDGRGVEQNYHTAAIHLGYAAERGDVEAQTLMAHLYYYGRGVQKDYQKTLQYLTQGLIEDNPAALALRGRMYYFGDGGKWDENEARILITKAVNLGNEDANTFLNSMRTTTPPSSARGKGSQESQAYEYSQGISGEHAYMKASPEVKGVAMARAYGTMHHYEALYRMILDRRIAKEHRNEKETKTISDELTALERRAARGEISFSVLTETMDKYGMVKLSAKFKEELEKEVIETWFLLTIYRYEFGDKEYTARMKMVQDTEDMIWDYFMRLNISKTTAEDKCMESLKHWRQMNKKLREPLKGIL